MFDVTFRGGFLQVGSLYEQTQNESDLEIIFFNLHTLQKHVASQTLIYQDAVGLSLRFLINVYLCIVVPMARPNPAAIRVWTTAPMVNVQLTLARCCLSAGRMCHLYTL